MARGARSCFRGHSTREKMSTVGRWNWRLIVTYLTERRPFAHLLKYLCIARSPNNYSPLPTISFKGNTRTSPAEHLNSPTSSRVWRRRRRTVREWVRIRDGGGQGDGTRQEVQHADQVALGGTHAWLHLTYVGGTRNGASEPRAGRRRSDSIWRKNQRVQRSLGWK